MKSEPNKWHGPRLLPNQKWKGKGGGGERRVHVEVLVEVLVEVVVEGGC